MSDSAGGVTQQKPWKDRDLVLRLRDDEGLTYREMAERLGCSESNVNRWLKIHRADELRKELDVEIPEEEPWKDGELLAELYHTEELSTPQISAVLDCSSATVNKWMDELGVEKRSTSEAISIAKGGSHGLWFRTNPRKGYERIACEKKTVLHHRLLAVAYWGLDAVRENHVHHENHIPWDNRKENLELVDPSTHSQMHRERKMNWLDALRATEMYDEGASTYELADVFDVAPGTVASNIRRVDPDLIRTEEAIGS